MKSLESPAGRRRRARIGSPGDEYMPMNIEVEPDWAAPVPQAVAATAASDSGPGFLGAARVSAPCHAGGLGTVPGAAFSEAPAAPLLPNDWRNDS